MEKSSVLVLVKAVSHEWTGYERDQDDEGVTHWYQRGSRCHDEEEFIVVAFPKSLAQAEDMLAKLPDEEYSEPASDIPDAPPGYIRITQYCLKILSVGEKLYLRNE